MNIHRSMYVLLLCYRLDGLSDLRREAKLHGGGGGGGAHVSALEAGFPEAFASSKIGKTRRRRRNVGGREEAAHSDSERMRRLK